MREILFRAKEKYDGDWVEGLLSKCEGEYIICDNSGTGIFIDQSTICQYTGLTSKSGNKIWEKDILSDDDMVSVVRWDDEEARFVIDDYGTKGCLMEYGFDECMGEYGVVETYGFDDFCSMKSFEVIGNVFDNKELLEG